MRREGAPGKEVLLAKEGGGGKGSRRSSSTEGEEYRGEGKFLLFGALGEGIKSWL